jgi:predicted PurR-regulated permease PerM
LANDTRTENEVPTLPTEWAVPRWAVIGIFLLLCIAAVALAGDFLMPVILAFLLMLVFTPLRRSLNRLGVPSPVCALFVIATLATSIGIGILMLTDPITTYIAQAPQIGREIEFKLRGLMAPVAEIAEAGKQIDELANGGADPGTPEVKLRQESVSDKLAAMAPMIGAQLVFVLVLLFFLIASGDMFYEKIVHVMPTFTDKRLALRIAFDIERRLARYLSTITLINALLGVAIGLTMWMYDMPTPELFGLLAFVVNFIPYVGAVVGVAVATLIALITFPDPWMSVLVGGTYLALTSIEGQLVTPYFVGRVLQLNTVIVFLAIAFWAWLWSVVGMIIAVPMLVVVRVFAEHVDALEPLGDFLTARGAEAAPTEEDPKSSRAAPTATVGK